MLVECRRRAHRTQHTSCTTDANPKTMVSVEGIQMCSDLQSGLARASDQIDQRLRVVVVARRSHSPSDVLPESTCPRTPTLMLRIFLALVLAVVAATSVVVEAGAGPARAVAEAEASSELISIA